VVLTAVHYRWVALLHRAILTAVYHSCIALLHTVIIIVFTNGDSHSHVLVILMGIHIAV
jgi:hypothetical protein